MRSRHSIKALVTEILTSLFISVLFTSTTLASPPRTDRTVYVHLFEWPWKDIALECENFLGPMGYAAVQVSPPMEHAVLSGYPWYQRYQVVSYQLTSRSGTRDEFIDMVRRCKAQGVDIYVDAVINHMTWTNRSGISKIGSAGTPYYEYEYPGIFNRWDFHQCGRNGNNIIRDFMDRWETQNCDLDTLADLRTEAEKVQNRLATYLNDLLDIGVAGFRIDAAKHIPAVDIRAIFNKLRRPFYSYQEVIFFGNDPIHPSEYYRTGDITEFRYGRKLAEVFNHGRLAWLSSFGQAWEFLPNDNTVVFVDTHDTQRGHGAGGEVLTHKDGSLYALANVFMLAWPYGYPQVMSSYNFSDHRQGPPSFENGATKPIYSPLGRATGCNGSDWLCEHRWPAIAKMVGFRNYVGSQPVTKWFSDGDNLIAFARGNRGYVIINRGYTVQDRIYDTGLLEGSYSDVISGKTILINSNRQAQITVGPNSAVAIHGGSRLLTRP